MAADPEIRNLVFIGLWSVMLAWGVSLFHRMVKNRQAEISIERNCYIVKPLNELLNSSIRCLIEEKGATRENPIPLGVHSLSYRLLTEQVELNVPHERTLLVKLDCRSEDRIDARLLCLVDKEDIAAHASDFGVQKRSAPLPESGRPSRRHHEFGGGGRRSSVDAAHRASTVGTSINDPPQWQWQGPPPPPSPKHPRVTSSMSDHELSDFNAISGSGNYPADASNGLLMDQSEIPSTTRPGRKTVMLSAKLWSELLMQLDDAASDFPFCLAVALDGVAITRPNEPRRGTSGGRSDTYERLVAYYTADLALPEVQSAATSSIHILSSPTASLPPLAISTTGPTRTTVHGTPLMVNAASPANRRFAELRSPNSGLSRHGSSFDTANSAAEGNMGNSMNNQSSLESSRNPDTPILRTLDGGEQPIASELLVSLDMSEEAETATFHESRARGINGPRARGNRLQLGGSSGAPALLDSNNIEHNRGKSNSESAFDISEKRMILKFTLRYIGVGGELRELVDVFGNEGVAGAVSPNALPGDDPRSEAPRDGENTPRSSVDLGGGANAAAVAECIICYSAPASIVMLPCRHCVVCDTCIRRLSNCPVCREVVQSIVSLFSSLSSATPSVSGGPGSSGPGSAPATPQVPKQKSVSNYPGAVDFTGAEAQPTRRATAVYAEPDTPTQASRRQSQYH